MELGFTVGKYSDIIEDERSEIEEELNVDIMDLRVKNSRYKSVIFLQLGLTVK